MMLLILVRIIDMRKFLVLFLFVSSGAFAQELDSLLTDTIPKPPPKHLIGGFVFLGFNESPGPNTLNSMRTVGAGLRYDKYEAGMSFSFFHDNYVERLIFPNFFNLVYAHGGAYVSYMLIESKKVHAGPVVMFQAGDIIWERADTSVDIFRDKFSLLQLGVKVEMPLLRYVRPELLVGYQSMSNFNLPEIDQANFTGFFVGFNVKVGYFNQ